MGDIERTPKMGDIVLYTVPDGPVAGRSRPAMVITVPDGTLLCNLIVFMDGTADGYPGYIVWRPAVKFSRDGRELGKWYWRPEETEL